MTHKAIDRSTLVWDFVLNIFQIDRSNYMEVMIVLPFITIFQFNDNARDKLIDRLLIR